jgi:hypothetical protein
LKLWLIEEDQGTGEREVINLYGFAENLNFCTRLFRYFLGLRPIKPNEAMELMDQRETDTWSKESMKWLKN